MKQNPFTSDKRSALTAGLLIMLSVNSSCEDERRQREASCDCAGKPNVFAVSGMEGTVFFDAEAERWGISVSGGGDIKEYILYDAVHVFFPCNPEAVYEFENKRVLFSGNAYDFPDQITVPAGTRLFCIEISAAGAPFACEPEDAPPAELPWDYPVKPGTDEWVQLGGYDERAGVSQIPDSILPGLSTADLTDLCLNYPFLYDASGFHDRTLGLDALFANFNGIRELYTRKEISAYILKYYDRDIHNLCLLETGPHPDRFITLSPGLDELLLSRIEWHGESDREEFMEILRSLVRGYEVERYYDSYLSQLSKSNRFARAHIIFKMNPRALETFPEYIVKAMLFNGALYEYNKEHIRAFDELSYKLIK
ncbi:MAG: hypothetical protein LBJ01_06310 [Tannerella sp.]|jgi:hypothetical protein|nr:hypothetical protein [Tannerella sp.]